MARLFEQGGDVEPQLTHRVAWGLSGVATKNSTWQTVVTWLQGTLSFLKPSNNLSDVADASTSLTNLGGVNSIQVNNQITAITGPIQGQVDQNESDILLRATKTEVPSLVDTSQFLQDAGGFDLATPVTITSNKTFYTFLFTISGKNHFKLPSITDVPTLFSGQRIVLKNKNASGYALYVVQANTDMPDSNISIGASYSAKFIFDGTTWIWVRDF